MKRLIYFSLVALTVLAGCGKEKINSKGKSYCNVYTEEATNISATGATLHGRFDAVDVDVTETGFVFDEAGDFNKNTSPRLPVAAKNRKLELEVSDLAPRNNYSFVAYIVANGTLLFGTEEVFNTTGVAVTGVTMSKPSATMTLSRENGEIVGKTLQLSASVSPGNASNKNISWSSSNTSVATVSKSGLVTATGTEGKTTITATADGTSHSDNCEITVSTVKLTGVSLGGGGDFRMAFETSHAITLTTTPANAYYTSLKFTSSDNAVAKVSDKGIVTGEKGGYVTIAVKIDGIDKGSVKLCVIPAAPEAIDLGCTGVKWARNNIGANDKSDVGFLYAFNRQSPDEVFTSDHYNETSGNAGDPAKYAWGGKWRLPTKSEIEELISKCTWKATTVDGVYGQEVRGNARSIFLPNLPKNTYGEFWSQASANTNTAWALHLGYSESTSVTNIDKYKGLMVRPVLQTY